MSENEQENVNERPVEADRVESSPERADPTADELPPSGDGTVKTPGIVERGMAALGIGDAEPEQEAAATPATKTYKQNAAANAATKRKRKYGR